MTRELPGPWKRAIEEWTQAMLGSKHTVEGREEETAFVSHQEKKVADALGIPERFYNPDEEEEPLNFSGAAELGVRIARGQIGPYEGWKLSQIDEVEALASLVPAPSLLEAWLNSGRLEEEDQTWPDRDGQDGPYQRVEHL